MLRFDSDGLVVDHVDYWVRAQGVRPPTPAGLVATLSRWGPRGPHRGRPGHGSMWRYAGSVLHDGRDWALRPADPLREGSCGGGSHYVSYGSVTRVSSGAPLYQATLGALAGLPLRVLMTTGRALDPTDIAPIPENSHVEQWWPQEAVMAEAAAVVGHGGFGTAMAALAARVPQAVLPLFSFDQAINAEHVAAANAGIPLTGGLAAVADLPAALRRVLADPAFAEGARAIAAEIAALPLVTEYPADLEQLANDRSKETSSDE